MIYLPRYRNPLPSNKVIKKSYVNHEGEIEFIWLCHFNCIILPLTPVLIDGYLGKSQYREIILTAAIYPISLFIQSQSKFLVALGKLLVVVFCYGLAHPDKSLQLLRLALISLWTVSLIHAIERYNLHIVKGETFFLID